MNNSDERDYAEESANRADMEREGAEELAEELAAQNGITFERVRSLADRIRNLTSLQLLDVADLLNEMHDIIAQMVDPNPCRYDHHDYCQEHALHPRPCPHERAQTLLGMSDGS